MIHVRHTRKSMHVCMSVYIYVCAYLCRNACMCAHTPVYISVHVTTYVCVCACKCVRIRLRVEAWLCSSNQYAYKCVHSCIGMSNAIVCSSFILFCLTPVSDKTRDCTNDRRPQSSASIASSLALDTRLVLHLPCFFTLSYSEPPRARTSDTSSS